MLLSPIWLTKVVSKAALTRMLSAEVAPGATALSGGRAAAAAAAVRVALTAGNSGRDRGSALLTPLTPCSSSINSRCAGGCSPPKTPASI